MRKPTCVEILCGGGEVPISLACDCGLVWISCLSTLGDLEEVPQAVETLVICLVSALRVISWAVACIFSSNAAQISSTDSIKIFRVYLAY